MAQVAKPVVVRPMQPDGSLIIAAYNAASTIERAIASALASTGVTVEIVVADDASSDDTAAIVAAIGDPRVHLCRSAVNQGPGGARNLALSRATGRYVSVLDADDTILPDRLARKIVLLDSTGAAAALDGVEVVDAKGGRSVMGGIDRFAAGTRIGLADYLRGNILFGSKHTLGYFKPTIRTSFLHDHRLRYAEDLRIGEDFVLMAEILASGGSCVVEPTVGYSYRVGAGSISRVLRLDHVRAMRAADERMLRERTFDTSSSEAFGERRRGFDDAEAFLLMVEALKNRRPRAFMREAFNRPQAMGLFRMPVAKRIRNWLPRARSSRPGQPQS